MAMAKINEPMAEWVDMVMTRLHSAEARVDGLQVDNDRLHHENTALRKELTVVVARAPDFAPGFRTIKNTDYFFVVPVVGDLPPIADIATVLYHSFKRFTIAYMPRIWPAAATSLIGVACCTGADTPAAASHALHKAMQQGKLMMEPTGGLLYPIQCAMSCEAVIGQGGGYGYRNIDNYTSDETDLVEQDTEEGWAPLSLDDLLSFDSIHCIDDARSFLKSKVLHHLTLAGCVAAVQDIRASLAHWDDVQAGRVPED